MFSKNKFENYLEKKQKLENSGALSCNIHSGYMDRMCHIESVHFPIFYNTPIDIYSLLCYIFFITLRISGIIFLLFLVCSVSTPPDYKLHEGRDLTFHCFSPQTNNSVSLLWNRLLIFSKYLLKEQINK